MPAARLTLADIAHRTLVSGLFGLSVYGCYGIWVMHNERLRLGLEALHRHEEEERRKREAGIDTSKEERIVDQIPSHRF